MKAKRTFPATRILLCFALSILLICAVSAFVFAEGAEPGIAKLSLGRTNLRYYTETDIIVEVLGTVPEGSEAGIAVWDFKATASGEELTLANVSYTNLDEEVIDGVNFYSTKGIAAKDIAKKLTIAPILKTGDEIELAGEKIQYSIIDYIESRLNNNDLEEYQVNLYRGLIIYGTKAEVIFNAASANTFVLTNNGYVGDKMLPIDIVDDGTAMLRAIAVNADGKYFSHWEDKAGNFVSGERIYNLTGLTKGLNEYTAVYTEKAASAYSYFTDFNQFALGEYKGLVGDLTEEQKASGTATITLPMLPKVSAGVTSFFGVNKVITFGSLEGLSDTDKIPVTSQDSLDIKEIYDGVNYLNIVKHTTITSYTTFFNNKSADNQTTTGDRLELDLGILKNTGDHHIYSEFIGSNYGYLDLWFARVTYQGKDCLRIAYNTTETSGSAACEKAYMYFDDNGGNDIISLAFGVDISGENGVVYICVNGVRQELSKPIALKSGSVYLTTLSNTKIYNPVSCSMEMYNVDFTWDVYSVGITNTADIKKQ